ncbi:hypothetical protein [Caulobacter sp. LjRoot300]|uniref:hypothetical protein n=1 Tax=Caulobacter sp. LjRoot300 TaxID=3342321 RepID=UPI003ECC7462
MTDEPWAKLFVDGDVDDLYGLAILFPEGAYPGAHVATSIVGVKDGVFDRVQDAQVRETYVTGDDCLALIEARGMDEASWMAREILAPLNGYATLADSNFKPVVATSLTWKNRTGSGGTIFGPDKRPPKPRLIATNRHPLLSELLPSRVAFMSDNPLAAYAASAIAGTPSWADYYRLLEDIAGYRGTSLDKLAEAGLADRPALNAFKSAANNRAFGRHGTSKRDTSIAQESLMTLLEAREFVRRVVWAWLNLECGGRMPRDRVDGGLLRFGLDPKEQMQ